MHEPSTDELLSAYLDGELTADEQVRAERLLAENPEARRLHGELRAMRSCLQGIAPQQLPEDFSARVLRAAEQRMLTERESEPSPASEAKNDRSPWQERIRRPLAYALIVLAASVLIAVFLPESQNREQPVATSAGPEATSETPPMLTMSKSGEEKAADAFDSRVGSGEGFGSRGDASVQMKLVDMADYDGGLLVVTCEITPAAARKDAFRQVLVNNRIELGVADDETAVRARARPTPREPAQGLGMQSGKKAAGVETGLEMVYVEASKEQLEATLTEISKKKEDFLSVDVGPTETQVAQNRWQRDFSRGRGNLLQQRVMLQSAEDLSTLTPTAPAATAPTQTTPAPAAEGTTPPVQAKQPAGNVAQNGRARGYSMPADGLATQRGKSLNEEQKNVDRTEAITKAGAGNAPAPTNATEVGTYRALFVLKVADDQQPAEEPARPATPPRP